MEIEESFPRGNMQKNGENLFKNENLFLFQVRKRKKSYSKSNSSPAKKQRVLDMNYSEITEGMLVLACVRTIKSMLLEVELPGKMSGHIKMTSISNPLNQLLEENIQDDDVIKEPPQLNDLFHVGQFIPTKVLRKNVIDSGIQLILSTNPIDIHRGWSYANFVKDSIIWAAIESELEHGYQLNIGITSCRVFLPSKNIENNVKYVIGQPLYCVVRKCTVDSDISTVLVSTLKRHMNKTMSNDNIDLLHITPGLCVNFIVTDILRNGLEGTFSKHNGYISEPYLNKCYEYITNYNIGDNYKAFLLYVEPDTKCAYFSLRGICSSSQAEYANGTLLVCKVFKHFNGAYLKLPNNKVGFVSYKRFGKDFENYPLDSQHTVKVLDYRHFEQIYICTFTTEKEEERKTLKIGDLVTAKIINVLRAGILVSLGKSKIFIPSIHLDKHFTPEIGSTVQAKVWSIKNDSVHLTVKKLFIDSDICLKNKNDAVVGQQYPGVVAKKGVKGILVVFYNDLRGILNKNYLRKVLGPDAYDEFEEGEVIVSTIENVKDVLILKLANKPKVKNTENVRVGDYVTGIVTRVCPNGLKVDIVPCNHQGFIPTPHLSACLSLTPLLLNTYKERDVIEELLCISNFKTPTLSIREARAYKKNNLKVLKKSNISLDTIIRCSVLNSFESRVRIAAPLIPASRILHLYPNNLDKGAIGSFETQQLIVTKVNKFSRDKDIIKLTARSENICKWNYDDALDYLEEYLIDVQRIQTCLSDKFAMSRLNLGDKVLCTVKLVNDEQCLLILEDNVQGIAERQQAEKSITVGDSVEGVVLWKDFIEDQVILSLKQDTINLIGNDQEACDGITFNSTVAAFVLVIKPEFIITVTKDKKLLFVPILKPNCYLTIPKYHLLQEINVNVVRKINYIYLGVDTFMLKILEDAKERYTNKSPIKKKSTPIQKESKIKINKQDIEDEENVSKYNTSLSLQEVLQNAVKPEAALPGVHGFFKQEVKSEPESSSDEDVEKVEIPKKKKKLTAAERIELTRQAEERLREKEIELADCTAEPQSEEQFERLILGNPNSSELWAKYMAYCVSNAEIHKARNIAKAALKRIDLNETQDRYNIWITSLNLENCYGDKESFNSVFEEAVRCNDDLDIYLTVINILADSGKYAEMNEKIKKVKTKHKQNLKMWTTLAHVYYKCGQIKDARNIQSSALKTVETKSNNLDLVVQFAIMEFKYGEKHHAEALFETILQSNPKRVDIWSTYVDQMIKKDNIDGARRILERAVAQLIPPKKMKILFKKYKQFEEKYGNEENVADVINLAKQYLEDK